jgi:hypothetical protein
MVPKAGFEPAREYSHCALNAARLPVPPLRHVVIIIISDFSPDVKSESGRILWNLQLLKEPWVTGTVPLTQVL